MYGYCYSAYNRLSFLDVPDSSATAFLTATGITDPTIKSAIDTLCKDLKSAGIFDKMNAIYPFVGGTATTHKFNLVNPVNTDAGFRLSFLGGWTHSANGVLPNGTNGYADTFLTPSTTLSLNNTSLSLYSRTNKSEASIDIGCQGGGNATYAHWNYATSTAFRGINSAPTTRAVIANTSGLLTASRIVSNNEAYYANGAIATNYSAVSTALTAQKIIIGARNNGGSADSFASKQYAFACIGQALSATEASNLYTAVQKFQTTLGRSIGTQVVSDADAQAFVTNANIDDQVQANAINDLVIGMKADGLWTKMKAIYPFVGGTATSHSFNLKDTSVHQITWFGGLTHDANGVTPNGTNGYGNLNFNPRTHIGTQSSYGTYCRVNNVANGKADFGSSNLDGWNHYMYLQNFGTCEYTQFRTFGNNILIANTTTNAFFHAGLDTNNDLFLYKNNTLLQSKTPAVIGTPPNINTTLFAHNANLTIQQFSPRPSSFFFAASGTTQEDNGNIYYCIQKFQTTLGRQVGTPIYSSNATDVNARLFLGATNIQDVTITSAVDTLVQGLKTDGVWSKLKAVYPFVGGTAATHKFNLANALDEDTSFRLAFNGGWTHDSNGVLPNGTNGYADTFLTPSTSLTQNSTHISLYSRTNKSEAAIDFGCQGGGVATYLNWNYLTTTAFRGINSAPSTRLPLAVTNTFLIASRIVSNNEMYFSNGIKFSDYSSTSSTPPTQKMLLGARNNGGSADSFSNKQFAFGSIGDGLTDTEASNLYTRVQAFQTTLNRQV